MVQNHVENIERSLKKFASKSFIVGNEGLLLSEQEKKQCLVYGSHVSRMTPSRIFSRFMSKFTFYNPRRLDKDEGIKDDKPSLDAAWAYYENVTLARTYANRKDEKNTYIRAQVGERGDTELYPYWKTSLRDLNSFGISVRMYFSTVLIVGVCLLFAGILNLPLLSYYWNYAEGGKDGISFVLKSSAICDESEWVECESCNTECKDYFPSYRLDGQNVLKNTCNFNDWAYPGIHSWVVSILLILSFLFAFFIYQKRAEIIFDEDIQTASDYAIKIVNPPPDAYDPEEWKQFFSQFTNEGIVSVTINLNNSDLLRLLVKRRKLIKRLKNLLPIGADLNDENVIKNANIHQRRIKSLFTSNAQTISKKIQLISEKITFLCKKKYKVTDVFVIFETERGQRNALHALATGRLNIWQNRPDVSKFNGGKLIVNENIKNSTLNDLANSLTHEDETEEICIKLTKSDIEDKDLTSTLMFRGCKVLRVKEAPEPFDVRWLDLQVGFSVRFVKCILTVIVLAIFISWSGVFIYRLSKKGNQGYTTIYISATNVIVPKICDIINGFEPHATEGKRQASLFVKMALFRCFNSALALLLVANFTSTISIEDGNEEDGASLIKSVYPVIFAELFTIPVIKLCDFMGNFRKHFLAPRARDQEEMNACMRGGKFELAERYTDSTKVLFVAMMYSSILPESYFLGAIACFIHYLLAKFCLLRMWRKAPDIGKDLGRLSRNVFLTTSCLVHLLASAYFWSGFPYDFVCGDDDNGYEFCNQDMFGTRLIPLPRFQKEVNWMTPSQEKITSLYGWTGIIGLVIGLSFLLKNVIYHGIGSIFRSTYEPDGKDQLINFHQVKHLEEVQAYIPQLRENGFEYPLIACDITNIDHDLLGWKDHLNGFDRHDLTHDAMEILGSTNNSIFSTVKYWPREESF